MVFKPVSSDHYDEWLAFFEDPASFRFWNGARESPREECRRWYEKQLYRYTHALGGMNALIEKKTGRLIGHAGLLLQEVDDAQYLEIAYSLLGPFRGSGFATEAARKCRDVAFRSEFANKLISIIAVTNEPSIAVARRNGMSRGWETTYNDNEVVIFTITREQWSATAGRQATPSKEH